MFSRYAVVAVVGFATTVAGVKAEEGGALVGYASHTIQSDYDFISNIETPKNLLIVMANEDDEVILGFDFIKKCFGISNQSDGSKFGKSTRFEHIVSVTIRTNDMDYPVTLKMKKDGPYTFVSSPDNWERYVKQILNCEKFGVKIGDDTHIFNMNQQPVHDAWHVYAMFNE
ncbi:hypothetical protein N9Z08_00215 [Pirellulales bacterium]|nr:hypothetical protein [Pirellulales bacterium]